MLSQKVLAFLTVTTGAALLASSGCNPPSSAKASGTGGVSGSGGSGAGGTSAGDASVTAKLDGPLGTGGQATGGTTAGGSGGVPGSGGMLGTGGSTGSGGSTVQGGQSGTGGITGSGGGSVFGGTTGGGGKADGGGTGGPTGDAGPAPRDVSSSEVLARDTGTGGSSGTGGAGTGGSGTGGATGTGGSTGPDSGVDPTKKIKVWLAGDSTMQPCTTACPCGWGSQFQPLFNSNVTVVNSGVGGRSIQTWLYDPNVTTTMDSTGECVVSPKTYSTRWQAMIDPTNGMKPGDYLFIEFGINDGDSTCNRHVGTALFQTYLGTMAQAAKDLGAQPIFLTSTSAIACSGSTSSPNRGFGPQTKAAGTANNVPVIDLTVLSAAFYTSLGLCPNSSDYTSTTSAVGQFFCDDHTHFEAAGAVQIAGVVAKALKDQGIGLASYLK